MSIKSSQTLVEEANKSIETLTAKEVKKLAEKKEITLTSEIDKLEHNISMLKNNDLDYLDMLYREKFKYGTKDEILIKLK